MAACKGCGKSITYHEEGGQWVPYNHPEGGRHRCEEYQKIKDQEKQQTQEPAQTTQGKAATGSGKEAPPQGGQSTGSTPQPPPVTQDKAPGPADKERLIVLQSSLKVAASLYGMSNHPSEDFDQVVEKVLEKAIQITGRLFREAGG